MPCDRHLKALPPTDEPVRQRAYDDEEEHGAGIVHSVASDGLHDREGHPDNNEEEVREGEEVNWDTPAAKFKGAEG
jgi:hypothetical protein